MLNTQVSIPDRALLLRLSTLKAIAVALEANNSGINRIFSKTSIDFYGKIFVCSIEVALSPQSNNFDLFSSFL